MDSFSDRLDFLFEYYDLNAAAFADKINVQRSSISHLLSGRNNPSLDFVIKVLDKFPEVTFNWLVKGQGDPFTKVEAKADIPKNTTPTLFDQEFSQTETRQKNTSPIDKFDKEILNEEKKIRPIARVLVLFKDGSFETYS